MALYALLALSSPLLSSAYTWKFNSQPVQCGNVSISVSGGSPPYQVLIIPYGSSPLPNNIEARKIQDEAFPGTSADISFKLNFPANSQFVAVVSDSTAFGSGGTSTGVLVGTSSDASCFDATQNVAPVFAYSIFPDGLLTQCVSTRLSWDKTKIQGDPKFQGVIPGGQSFEIPIGSITDVQSEGTGFSWTPPLRGMTTVLLVGGDNRGNGSAGSTLYIVGAGIANDVSCLNSTSPTSTAGDPAGGSYPTGSSTSSSGSSSSGSSSGAATSKSSSNVGAIAGGTVGGIAFLIALLLVALFFLRRRRLHKTEKERPDLLTTDEGDDGRETRNELPQYYQPEPFMVADPTADDRRTSGVTDPDGRPISGVMSESRSGTPDPSTSMSTSTRKTGPMRQMRPVNIIQHADAGPSTANLPGEEEPETVELPPAYTNIRK